MIWTFLRSAINFSTIYLYGSIGETITEKSGHLNLGTPGIMCIGTIGGCLGEYIYLQSLEDISMINGFAAVIIPILMTLLFAGLAGLLFSFMTVSLRCNQNVTGLTITTFGVGFLKFFIEKLCQADDKGYGFSVASKFFAGNNIDGWFGKVFFSHGVMVYLAIAFAVITTIIFKKTRVGLYLSAVGENPGAADAAGINVTGYRYTATILGSAITGLGGLYFIMDYLSGGASKQIDSFGWLAVALVIFTVWKPNWSILGSIVFAAMYIASNYLTVNKELFQILPYAVTILVLIVTSIVNKKSNQPPASLGLSYFREER